MYTADTLISEISLSEVDCLYRLILLLDDMHQNLLSGMCDMYDMSMRNPGCVNVSC